MEPDKVRLSNVRYAVGGVEILKGVTTSVDMGEVVSIVGPSGAGKSTLLRTVNRLVEPTSGEIFLDGVATSEMNPLELRRRVGMVFQLPALFGETVADVILYGLRLVGRSTDVRHLLESVGLNPSIAGRDPQSLSVGQQQRVSIARALALEPEVLLMDEPTSALDQAARQRVEDLIEDLNSRLDLTIVVVSHALDQVERVADRVLLLVDGRSEGEWSKEEFFYGKVAKQVRQFIAGEL
ncbi:MAG: phosphate ABC transporter ATP-binding protein [Rubrobacter sp.]|nr:phosphate ABC transporter ATP-binding protein [Rubrobacter sp.]